VAAGSAQKMRQFQPVSSLPEMFPAFRIGVGQRYPDILQERHIDAGKLSALPGSVDPGEDQVHDPGQPILASHRAHHRSVVESQVPPPMGVQQSRVESGNPIAPGPRPEPADRDQGQPQPIPKACHRKPPLAKVLEEIYDFQKCMRMADIK
jgi:hypothetical protein